MKQAQLDTHASSLCVKVAWLHRVGGTPPPLRGSDRSGSPVLCAAHCHISTQEIPEAFRPATEAPTRHELYLINSSLSLVFNGSTFSAKL